MIRSRISLLLCGALLALSVISTPAHAQEQQQVIFSDQQAFCNWWFNYLDALIALNELDWGSAQLIFAVLGAAGCAW